MEIMNFDFEESNFTFPEVKLDTRYEDDDFKLHSDLVGVDFNAYLETKGGRKGGGAAAFEMRGGASGADAASSQEQQSELLQMSLPLFDPRKSSKTKEQQVDL